MQMKGLMGLRCLYLLKRPFGGITLGVASRIRLTRLPAGEIKGHWCCMLTLLPPLKPVATAHWEALWTRPITDEVDDDTLLIEVKESPLKTRVRVNIPSRPMGNQFGREGFVGGW